MKHVVVVALLVCSQWAHAQMPAIDYSFQAASPDGVVNKILLLPDGRMLLGGAFYDYAGTQRQGLVRLHTDGTLDASWNPGAYGLNGTINDMEVMADGRIMIGGTIISYNGVSCGNLARLHPDGTLDPSFVVPHGAINGPVLQLELQGGTKVVAGGDFQHCYGISQPYIARFNYDGTLDTDFNIGLGFFAAVRGLKVMPDQRILAVGNFTWFHLTNCMYMARLHADGTYDSTFVAYPGLHGTFAHGRSVDLQADGKVLVAGSFTHHDGTPANDLIRLHPDGSRDESFTSPFSAWATVNAVKVLPDGRILAGGEFTTGFYWPSAPAPARFVRLNADGSWDSSLPLATGFTPEPAGAAFIKDMVLQPDGRILVGGMFAACDGETQYANLIRLNTELTVGLDDAPHVPALQLTYDAHSHEVILDLQNVPHATALAMYTAAGQLVFQQQVTTPSNGVIRLRPQVRSGIHLVRVWNDAGSFAGKVWVP